MTLMRACLLTFLLTIPSIANAQLPQTRLYSLSRSGGQIGTEVELVLTSGADLDEVTRIEFSHSGITAKQKTTDSKGKQVPVNNTFLVKVAENVPVGIYEVRAGGLWGLSNPRRFVVSERIDSLEVEDNNSPEKATPLEINSAVNARLQAGSDIDWYRFAAKQGESIIFDCWSERIDSKMDAALTIFDSSGYRRLDYARNVKGSDPTLLFEVPADGEYLVKIHDQTYRNGNEYFYRLEAHTGPYVELSHPPAGKAGTNQKVTLFGYNLPGGTPAAFQIRGNTLQVLTVEVPIPNEGTLNLENRVRPLEAEIDAFTYRLPSPKGFSNPIRIGITPTNVIVEQEPNNSSGEAQKLSVPIEVGGNFANVGDTDTYRFEAKAGQVLYVEAIAERMGVATDLYLVVQQVTKKEDGTEVFKRLTAQDDVATTLLANVFDTKTDDPSYKLTVPADGLYEVTVRDRYWESRGSLSLSYRLAIREESPDFRLVALPDAPTAGQTWPLGLRKGDNFPMKIFAFREHGYQGPISIRAKDLPKGFTSPEIVIAEKATSGTLIVSTTSDITEGSYQITLEGFARIDNPSALKAIDTATKSLQAARKPIGDLEKTVAAAQAEQQKAQQAHTAATKASADKPEDEGLKKKLEQSKQAVDKATATLAQAKGKLTAANATKAKEEQALAAANQQREQQAKSVTRTARAGTIAWSGANNVPAIARLTNAITCSVLPETAPFQIVTDLHKIEVNQSRQVLVPVKLEKRTAFDNKVTFTPQGLPKGANIDFKLDPIDKGASEQLMRLFIKDNAPAGTHTLWLKSTGQVAYRRNLKKAEQLNKANEELKKQVEAANKAVQEATKQKDEAVAALTQLNQKVDQTQKNVATQQAMLTTLKQQLQQAEQNRKQQAANLTKTQADLKSTSDQLEQVNVELTKAEKESKKATEEARDELQNTVDELKRQQDEKTQQAATVQKRVEAANKSYLNADQQLKQKSEAVTKAEKGLAVETTTLDKLKAEAKTANEAKAKQEQLERDVQNVAKQLEAKRKVAEKAATTANNVAKAKNINFTPPSMPLVIEVKPAPFKLTATADGGGALKQGGTVAVKIKITRQNGFSGPVTLTLPAVPVVTGISARPVEVPADQSEATISLTAAKDATTGELAHLIVRAIADFNGKAAVDIPVKINVSK